MQAPHAAVHGEAPDLHLRLRQRIAVLSKHRPGNYASANQLQIERQFVAIVQHYGRSRPVGLFLSVVRGEKGVPRRAYRVLSRGQVLDDKTTLRAGQRRRDAVSAPVPTIPPWTSPRPVTVGAPPRPGTATADAIPGPPSLDEAGAAAG